MTIVIIGSGTMGSGIAEVVLAQGGSAILVDPDATARERARTRIAKNLARSFEKGRIHEQPEDALARLDVTDTAPVDGVEWVVEAVPEDVALKQGLFADLDARYPETVWLASNTSSIAIGRLQSRTRHPERVGGLHFFNPVPRMQLVEIIRGLETSEAYLKAARALTEKLGKTGVIVPDRPGFLVNRAARSYYLEALRMVDEGEAAMEVVDEVMEGAGFPMGPFRVMDLVGVDVNLSVTKSVYEQTYFDERYRPHPWQEELVERGYWGRKSGRGFYRYE